MASVAAMTLMAGTAPLVPYRPPSRHRAPQREAATTGPGPALGLPKGMGKLVSDAHDDLVVIHRQSKRSYRWKIVNTACLRSLERRRLRSGGNATTEGQAERDALAVLREIGRVPR